MEIKQEIVQIAKKAKKASGYLGNLSSKEKNKALKEMAKRLEENTHRIKEKNDNWLALKAIRNH